MKIIDIDEIEFEEPNDAVLKMLTKRHRSNYITLIITDVILLTLVYYFFVLNTAHRVVGLIPFLLILAVSVGLLLHGMFRLPKYGVCFGTVLEHYRDSFDDMTRDFVAIRLDETGEVVKKIQVAMFVDHDSVLGMQVLLCKQKKVYMLYPAAGLKPKTQDTNSGQIQRM